MSRRARWILSIASALAVLVVVGCEYLVRAVAVPSYTNCTKRGTFVAIDGFHDADGDRAHGCHAGEPFTPKVERRDAQLVVEVPRDAAEAFADRATLRLHAKRLDHANQAWWFRLIDIGAPFSHLAVEVAGATGEPQQLELSLPAVVIDAGNPRLEFDASQLEDDVTLLIAVRSQQRA